MPQEFKHDSGGKDYPPDEVDDSDPRLAPVDTAGVVELIRKPPRGLFTILAAYVLGLTMCVAVRSQTVIGLLPPDLTALFQPFFMVPGVLMIACAWILAHRFFHRGRIWALGTCARLREEYKEYARDQSSCCEKDVKRAGPRRNHIEDGNLKYTHRREEFRESLNSIWLVPVVASAMIATIIINRLGVDPASQWVLAMLGGLTAVLIMLPVFKLARQLSSLKAAGLSRSDRDKIDAENECRRQDADASKKYAQFYKDAVNAVRGAVKEIGASSHVTES